jgi:hypothetical protein
VIEWKIENRCDQRRSQVIDHRSITRPNPQRHTKKAGDGIRRVPTMFLESTTKAIRTRVHAKDKLDVDPTRSVDARFGAVGLAIVWLVDAHSASLDVGKELGAKTILHVAQPSRKRLGDDL